MFNVKDFSDIFVIRKERDDFVIKEFIGNIEGTLTIPDGITRISEYAFTKSKCSKINKIIFPKTLKRIPDCNFKYWEQLVQVVIPEGITSIANCAFEGTGINEILLPSTINKIGKYAFSYCENLKKVTILHLSTSLLNSLLNESYFSVYPERKLNFSLYFGLNEDIDLSKIFNKYYNPRNEKFKFSIQDWFVMYGDYVVGYVGKGKNITIPDSAIGIAPEAFIFNKKIQNVTLGKKVKSIGESAFEGCSLLNTVFLNDNLERIEAYAFADSGLKNIKIPVKVKSVGEGAFIDCKNLQSITIIKNLIGDHYRLSEWNIWWDKGFYGEKKKEYIDNM